MKKKRSIFFLCGYASPEKKFLWSEKSKREREMSSDVIAAIPRDKGNRVHTLHARLKGATSLRTVLDS